MGLHLRLSSLQGLFSHIKQYSKKKERKREKAVRVEGSIHNNSPTLHESQLKWKLTFIIDQ